MGNAFFSDILGSIAERGRSLLRLRASSEDSAGRLSNVLDLCWALLSGRGEASGVALAREILDRYAALDLAARSGFFAALADKFGVDRAMLEKALARFDAEADAEAMQAVHYASEPRRQELFRRLNLAPGGTAALVAMRADMLDLLPDHPELSVVNRDFTHLLTSWFNRGFLVLRRIDWSTPANILEKIIYYEAVHEIRDWNDLRRRIDPPDRRCYAFFHPALIDEPLIFVQIALTDAMPDAIQPLLAQQRQTIAPASAKIATFYSISNCQKGLAGVSFGHFLLKQVVEELRRDLPGIETFVTLSPVPGFRAWLSRADETIIDADTRATLLALADDNWISDQATSETLRRALVPLAAYYFVQARRADGRMVDPVARFHLGNGARLERIDWMGDLSPKGLANSAGVMVNYLYNLEEIERNHEAFANQGEVVASSAVKRLLKDRARSRLAHA